MDNNHVTSDKIYTMKQSILLLFGFGLGFPLLAAVEQYVNCLSCPFVASPSDCRQSITCGEGEICFAREFKDHHGLRSFRLGCEEETRCNHFLNTTHMYATKDLNSVSAPSGRCYECCSGDTCNRHLCLGKTREHAPKILHKTTSCPTCNCPQMTCPTTTSKPCDCPSCNCRRATCPSTHPGSCCPPLHAPHNNKEYVFATWAVFWDEARTYCQNHAGDLVSINSLDEQDYLVQQLKGIGLTTYANFWTGGFYSQSNQAWMWVDGTPLMYTNWYQGQPSAVSHDPEYYIHMGNPPYHSVGYYTQGRWYPSTSTTATKNPFICEKQQV